MLKARIARLERRRPRGKSGVVRCLPGESVADAAARADAEGYTGALITPAPLDSDAWERAAAADSAERDRLQAQFIAAHRVEPDAPPVVRRREVADAASPQPAPTHRPTATVPLGRK